MFRVIFMSKSSVLMQSLGVPPQLRCAGSTLSCFAAQVGCFAAPEVVQVLEVFYVYDSHKALSYQNSMIFNGFRRNV